MAPAIQPVTRRVRARRALPALRRLLVLVLASGLMSVLSGVGPASAGAATSGPPPRLDPGLIQLAQLPTDPPPDPGDDQEGDDSDTLDVSPTVPAEQQQVPDTTMMHATPTPSAASDTTGAVPPGATGTVVDSTGAVLRAPAQTAGPDTLFIPSTILPAGPKGTTGTTPAVGTQPQAMPGPKPEAKKPRTGLFGIHPIAILVGLAALHYVVMHAVD